ncbi:hypothetical protein BH24ACT22_BH24ACT22_13130 [soil metagenome]
MKKWTAIVLQVLLGLAFLFSGVSKLTGMADAMREQLEIAPWFWIFTALVEVVGAAGMLAGIQFPRLAAPAGLWIAALMIGALVAHLRIGDPFTNMIPAAVNLMLALGVVALRGDSYVPRKLSHKAR